MAVKRFWTFDLLTKIYILTNWVILKKLFASQSVQRHSQSEDKTDNPTQSHFFHYFMEDFCRDNELLGGKKEKEKGISGCRLKNICGTEQLGQLFDETRINASNFSQEQGQGVTVRGRFSGVGSPTWNHHYTMKQSSWPFHTFYHKILFPKSFLFSMHLDEK